MPACLLCVHLCLMPFRDLHSFPTRRSSDLEAPRVLLFAHMDQIGLVVRKIETNGLVRVERLGGVPEKALTRTRPDRKSTRLNSSHLGISYAVFCLKKKNRRSPNLRRR